MKKKKIKKLMKKFLKEQENCEKYQKYEWYVTNYDVSKEILYLFLVWLKENGHVE